MGLDVGLDGGDAWERHVREATGGRGADVILDLVGAPYLARNQAAVAVGGRHVVVGVPGGSRAKIDLRALMVRQARLFGTVLRARGVEEKAALASEFSAEVLPGFGDGWLVPVIDRVFHVARAADAHRRGHPADAANQSLVREQGGFLNDAAGIGGRGLCGHSRRRGPGSDGESDAPGGDNWPRRQ